MTKHLKIVLEQWGAVLEPTRPFGSQRGGGQKVQNSSLAVDLSLANADLQISPAVPNAGSQVNAQLTVHNSGSLPAPFVHVSFYAGASKVATVASEVPLAGGDSRILTVQFAYPFSGGDIIAIVNEDQDFTELTYDNNRAAIPLSISAPLAVITSSASSGLAPVSVDFDASGSTDPAGSALTFNWLFSDGTPPVTGANVSHSFLDPGVYSVTLNATNTLGRSNTTATTVTVVLPAAPVFKSDGVVDAANFSAGISPGSLATLFGTGLSSATGIVSAQDFPLPLRLQDASITVNGIDAPILAVADIQGSEQINFQVPFETSPGQAQIVVSSAAGGSIQISVPVLPAKPAVFGSATTPIVTHGLTGALVSASSPAKQGETVIVCCTGLGPVTPSVPTGSPAPTATLSTVVLPFAASVGGEPAVVDFAGLAPTFAGLYQINLEIPADVTTGTSVQLVISVNGYSSVPVSLAIAQ
jgi:uncharacterized protein (TIGR03437 family)